MNSDIKRIEGLIENSKCKISSICIEKGVGIYNLGCRCGTPFYWKYEDLLKVEGLVSCGCRSPGVFGGNNKFEVPIKSLWKRLLGTYNNQFELKKGVGYLWANNYMRFYNWCLDNGYRIGYKIERIDERGLFEPNNCRIIKG